MTLKAEINVSNDLMSEWNADNNTKGYIRGSLVGDTETHASRRGVLRSPE